MWPLRFHSGSKSGDWLGMRMYSWSVGTIDCSHIASIARRGSVWLKTARRIASIAADVRRYPHRRKSNQNLLVLEDRRNFFVGCGFVVRSYGSNQIHKSRRVRRAERRKRNRARSGDAGGTCYRSRRFGGRGREARLEGAEAGRTASAEHG